MSHPGVPYTEYFAGATVRSVATFVNAAGQAADPTTVTAQVQFGPPNIVPFANLTVVKDSVGHYHALVTDGTWTGPGPLLVTVTWTGSGAITAVIIDQFLFNPNPSTATDVLGP